MEARDGRNGLQFSTLFRSLCNLEFCREFNVPPPQLTNEPVPFILLHKLELSNFLLKWVSASFRIHAIKFLPEILRSARFVPTVLCER